MSLSVKQIQKALYVEYRLQRWLWFSANTKALGYESDFIGITSKKITTEFEIKRSHQDFLVDFRNKKNKHRLIQNKKYPINFFYFVCEKNLISEKEVPYPYGLIYVEELSTKHILVQPKQKKYKVSVVKKASKIHDEKITDYLLIKLLTSMSYKWFEELKSHD